MEVYIARQPIFDRKMNIYGYELLYRSSEVNHFAEIDDDFATAELLRNSFMVFGLSNLTDGAKAFINFSKELINSDIPLLLPTKDTVIEILERGEVTQQTVEACEKIRAQGYMVALDDYVISDEFLPLLNCVDIIKVEYPSVSPVDQPALVKNLKQNTNAKLLAEKIETREDYNLAVKLGYDFFQGYFFSKPTLIQGKEIVSLDTHLLDVAQELRKAEPNYSVIANIIESDVGFAYKLLTLVNSVYIGSKHSINSIPQALAYIGIKEMYQWVSIMMLKGLSNIENAELIKLSLIRAKLMELIARQMGHTENVSEYFLTGMLSFINTLLNRPMKSALEGLPLNDVVKRALLGEQNDPGVVLKCIIEFETFEIESKANRKVCTQIGKGKFMELYTQALIWARKFEG